MTLSEIRALLDQHNIRLTKSLGQNFLHDGNQLRRIVASATIESADRVLEIGPGLGPLTELLLAQCAHVEAIETDHRLVSVLQQRFAAHPRFSLLHADALEVLRQTAASRDWIGWKVVSNLPYSVASPILVELALQPIIGPDSITVTLQLEVVRRLMASPGDPDYGLLTVLVRQTYEPAGWFKVPKGCFFPEPGIDSGCITLQRRNPDAVILRDTALRRSGCALVKRAFSQRRKMVAKLLRQDFEAASIEAAFEQLGIRAEARAETLDPDTFGRLAQILAT